MNLSEVQDVVFSVFKDYRVILCTIGVIFYLNFISYIVTYHKKPPRIKTKKKTVAAPAPAPQAESEESDDAEAAPSARK